MSKKAPTKKIPIVLPGVALADLVRIYAPTVIKILNPSTAKSCGCCCNCCCCCAKRDRGGNADPQCSVDDFRVDQDLRLDPNSFAVPGGPTILSTRAKISWSVTAPVGSTVTVQVRTRGLDGNPGVPFADWTNTQFTNQSLIDQVQFNFNDFLGTKVEFRVVVLDSSGTTICVGPPDC